MRSTNNHTKEALLVLIFGVGAVLIALYLI